MKLALAPIQHQPWCDLSTHQVTSDPERGQTEPCLSRTVDDGDAFAYLDGTQDNNSPRLMVVIPPSHGGFTISSYSTWRARIDELAAHLPKES